MMFSCRRENVSQVILYRRQMCYWLKIYFHPSVVKVWNENDKISFLFLSCDQIDSLENFVIVGKLAQIMEIRTTCIVFDIRKYFSIVQRLENGDSLCSNCEKQFDQ